MDVTRPRPNPRGHPHKRRAAGSRRLPCWCDADLWVKAMRLGKSERIYLNLRSKETKVAKKAAPDQP